MSNDNITAFNELYNKAFDKDGRVKVCGREVCKKLIKLASSITDTGMNYGNPDTGYMEIENMHGLYGQLNMAK